MMFTLLLLGTGHSQIASLALADSLYHRSDFTKALGVYEKLLEFQENQRHLLHRQALCYARLGEHRVAVRLFLNYLGRYPTDSDARLMLGHVYRWMGDDENAGNQYRTLLKMDPDYSEAALTLAALHMKSGEWRYAKVVLEKWRKKKPQTPGLRLIWDRLKRVSRPIIRPEFHSSAEEEWDEGLEAYVVELGEIGTGAKVELPWRADQRSSIKYGTGILEELNTFWNQRNYAVAYRRGGISHTVSPSEKWNFIGGAGVSEYSNRPKNKFRLKAAQYHLNLSAFARYSHNNRLAVAGFARGSRLIKNFDDKSLKVLEIDESMLKYHHRFPVGCGVGGVLRYASYELDNRRYDVEGLADFRPARLKSAYTQLMWQYTDFEHDVSEYYSYEYRNRFQGLMHWEPLFFRQWKAFISLRGHWDGIVETVNAGMTHSQSGCDSSSSDGGCVQNTDRVGIQMSGYELKLGLSWEYRSRFGCALLWNRYRNTRNYKAGGIRLHGHVVF